MAEVVKSKVFKQRSASILKKALELSVLCDIRVCALIVDPNGKEILTYPENHSDAIHLLKQFTRNKTTSTMTTKKKKKLDRFDDKLIDGLSKVSVIEISKMLNLKIGEARNRVRLLKKKEQAKQQQPQPAPAGFLINPVMLDFPPISRVTDLTYFGRQQLSDGGGGIDLGTDWKFSNFEPEVVTDLPPPLSYLPGVDDNGCCSSSSIRAPLEEVLGLLQHSPLEADMSDIFDYGSPMATYPLQPMPPLDYCFN